MHTARNACMWVVQKWPVGLLEVPLLQSLKKKSREMYQEQQTQGVGSRDFGEILRLWDPQMEEFDKFSVPQRTESTINISCTATRESTYQARTQVSSVDSPSGT